MVRAGAPPMATDRRSPTIRRWPHGSAASTFPRRSSARSSQRLGFAVVAGLDGHRADLAARHRRRRPTSSRKSSASTGSTRSPASPLPRADGVARPTATPEQRLERRLRRAAAARGLNEAVTWSFMPGARRRSLRGRNGGLWVLENPISEDMKAMRPSLLPGLLAAARRNLDRGASGVRLFEIGRRYLRGEAGASDERPTLARAARRREGAARLGDAARRGRSTRSTPRPRRSRCSPKPARRSTSCRSWEKPGRSSIPGQSATLRLGPKTVLARFGALHPATLAAFDVDGPVVAVELFLDAIPARKGGESFARAAYAPPALQAVTRDFAFLVPAELPAGDLLRAVRGADKANIVDARVFDAVRRPGRARGPASRWRSRSRSSRARRATPTRSSRRSPTGSSRRRRSSGRACVLASDRAARRTAVGRLRDPYECRTCGMDPADRAWLEGPSPTGTAPSATTAARAAVAARGVRDRRPVHLPALAGRRFDARACPTAVRATARRQRGALGPISFASGDAGGYFAMSLPSVWRRQHRRP